MRFECGKTASTNHRVDAAVVLCLSEAALARHRLSMPYGMSQLRFWRAIPENVFLASAGVATTVCTPGRWYLTRRCVRRYQAEW